MKRFLTFLLALVVICASFAAAQEQTGIVIGTVKDAEGAPLPGVTIEGTSPTHIGTVQSITDEVGRYRLVGLTPGTFTITFSLPGFNTLRREKILVRLGRTYSVEITLSQTTMEEEVTVIGESPVVDIKKSGTTTNIGKEMFAKLPKGRDFTSVVTVAAGVNEEDMAGGTSMDGASGSENMFFVDGVDTTSMYEGTSSQRVVFEFVEEVQVKSSGYEAEFGGSMGGVINVITRSGGNEFHGELSAYMSGSALQALPGNQSNYQVLRINPVDDITAEYIDYPEDDWNTFDVGLGLGGYMLKDRLWFFGSFMPRFTNTDRTVTFLDDNVERTTSQKQTSYFAQGKLTAQPFGGLRLSASYINDFYKWRGALAAKDGTGATDYEYDIYGFDNPGFTTGFRADYIASDSLFFALNGGYFRTNEEQLIGPAGPRYYFLYSNIGMGGEEHGKYWYNYSYNDGYQTTQNIQNRFVGNFDTTFFVDLAGEHVWKLGVQAVRLGQDVDDAYPYDYNRYYWGQTYRSPNPAIGDVEGTYGYLHTREPFGTIAKINSMRWAIFLQDSWTIADKLTLNLGIRAEKEDIPSFSDLPEYQDPPIQFGFGDKIAPRIGFAYDVLGDSTFKVFGSFGLYYDVMKLEMAEGSYGGFKWISHYYEMNTLDWKIGETTHPDMNMAPDFVYIESLNWRIPSFDTTQPDMQPYSKIEYTAGIQRKLGEDVSLTARWLHNRILWAIEDIGVQTPAGEQYYNGNPGSDWINSIYLENLGPNIPECPKAQRRYHSVSVGLDKRFSNNWMGGVHYTWSNLWGNFSGLASSDEFGRRSPNVERYFDMWHLHRTQTMEDATGKLPTDRPHQFKVYGSYTFDFGLTIGFYSYAMSGTPVSRQVSINSVGFYPLGRFTDGRTAFLTRTDLYLEYNFKFGGRYSMQVNANITNLFNQRIAQRIRNSMYRQGFYLDDEYLAAGINYLTEATAAGVDPEPRFLMPYQYTDGIDVRLGLKFIF